VFSSNHHALLLHPLDRHPINFTGVTRFSSRTVAIARVIVTDLALILADEPMENLDAASAQDVRPMRPRWTISAAVGHAARSRIDQVAFVRGRKRRSSSSRLATNQTCDPLLHS